MSEAPDPCAVVDCPLAASGQLIVELKTGGWRVRVRLCTEHRQDIAGYPPPLSPAVATLEVPGVAPAVPVVVPRPTAVYPSGVVTEGDQPEEKPDRSRFPDAPAVH